MAKKNYYINYNETSVPINELYEACYWDPTCVVSKRRQDHSVFFVRCCDPTRGVGSKRRWRAAQRRTAVQIHRVLPATVYNVAAPTQRWCAPACSVRRHCIVHRASNASLLSVHITTRFSYIHFLFYFFGGGLLLLFQLQAFDYNSNELKGWTHRLPAVCAEAGGGKWQDGQAGADTTFYQLTPEALMRPVKEGNLPTEILLEDTDGLHRPP